MRQAPRILNPRSKLEGEISTSILNCPPADLACVKKRRVNAVPHMVSVRAEGIAPTFRNVGEHRAIGPRERE